MPIRSDASRRAAGRLALALAVAAPAGIGGAARADDSCPVAGGYEACVHWCGEQFPGADQRERRFTCYDAIEQGRTPSAAGTAVTPPAAGAEAASPPPATSTAVVTAPVDRPAALQHLWDASTPLGFQLYRQNYLLFSDTSAPNDDPTSSNPANRVTDGHRLRHVETKFQFSLKARVPLPAFDVLDGYSLWFGYTQQSHWQILDAANSRPFRESDYQPELVVSRRLSDAGSTAPGWRPLFVNVGVVHQSNGQSDPQSRSWNRAYVEGGFFDRLPSGASLMLLARPWWRFPESAANDNNPDITRYLGYGDVELIYASHGGQVLSLLARIRSLQLDWSIPAPGHRDALNLHLQVFTGYGESLIDYNQRHTTVGLGVSLPYGL